MGLTLKKGLENKENGIKTMQEAIEADGKFHKE